MSSRTTRTAPWGFEYVLPTVAEITAYTTKHDHLPTSYRLRCMTCRERIWGSGLGIGAHRKGCTRPASKS